MASADGSWNLTITVTDLQVERTLRVTGDLHVGGVMVQLVEALDIAMDWSDHSLWWPERNTWLTRSRSTLNQYNVQADAKLNFTPMHKNVRVQLPDLQIIDQRMDFSRNVFSAVILLCKELGIRHPEELSIMRYMDKDDLKKSIKENLNQKKKKDSKDELVMGVNGNGTVHHSSSGSLDRLSPFSRSPAGPSPNNTLSRTPGLTPGPTMTQGISSYSANSVSPYNTFNSTFNANGTMSPGSMYSLSFESCMENALANSPPVSIRDAQPFLYKPKNYVEKARINYSWLDSSKSLMEQGIRDNDFILLKYKFFSFYDLNQKYDAVRINQIYEQAKWNILSEEVDCTEEEMMMFAALQLQIQTQASQPQANDSSMMDNGGHTLETDDIDADLTNLEESLEGSMLSSPGDITAIPELCGEIKFLKPKKIVLRKSYSRAWCTFKDTHIAFYKSREESQGAPFMRINTKGCESHPDLNISSKKYGMKLFVPESDGMSEVWLRFDMEEQYCKWMAACKLASQGKTMADSSYETEVQSLKTMLSRQHLTTQPGTSPTIQVDINSEDFVAPRFYKKIKSKQLQQRVLEAHANVQNLNLIDAKMAFIKAWQALPDFGITYFIIKQKGAKKEELLGVAYNRIIRMDVSSGDSLKTWRYNTLKNWHVNWEVKQVFLDFEGERLTFACLNADCKVVHEYIGGYIFLSMRSQDKNQTLNEELFHKLTGGWNKSIVL